MGLFKKGALMAVFMVVADLVIAAFTGFSGLHTLVVDGGAMFGEWVGMPQPDWGGVLEFFGIDWHGGHNHGALDHAIAQTTPEPAPGVGW
jgi:hypothetical protein